MNKQITLFKSVFVNSYFFNNTNRNYFNAELITYNGEVYDFYWRLESFIVRKLSRYKHDV